LAPEWRWASQPLYRGARAALPGMGGDGHGELDPATGYVRMFNAFFASGDMNATYKAVFLKSLLDLGMHGDRGLPGGEWIRVDGDTVTLDLNFVAARFIKHYWDRDRGPQLRQAKNRGVPTIVQLVRERSRAGGAGRPPTLEDLVSGPYRRLRRDAITRVIQKQALTYLEKDMGSLHTWERGSDTITLNADTIPFFRRHRETIKRGLKSKIDDHIEGLNPGASRPAVWPTGATAEQRALHPEARQFMDGEQRQRCFYCGRRRGEEQDPRIDHVMPTAYAFFTGLHNCVAACAGCALKKRGLPPSPALFLGVLDRNDGLEGRLARLPDAARLSFAGYDGMWYRKTYTACLAENRGDAGFFRP